MNEQLQEKPVFTSDFEHNEHTLEIGGDFYRSQGGCFYNIERIQHLEDLKIETFPSNVSFHFNIKETPHYLEVFFYVHHLGYIDLKGRVYFDLLPAHYNVGYDMYRRGYQLVFLDIFPDVYFLDFYNNPNIHPGILPFNMNMRAKDAFEIYNKISMMHVDVIEILDDRVNKTKRLFLSHFKR